MTNNKTHTQTGREEHNDVALAKRSLMVGFDGIKYRVINTNINGDIELATPRSAFGEQLMAELTPVVQLQFPYNINNRLIKTTLVAGGTVTQANAMAVVGTSTTTGSTALMESKTPIKYNPGQGGMCRFTALFTTGVTGTNQEIGIGDSVDCFCVGIKDTNFGVNRRVDSVNNIVTQSNFNIDTLDGNGPSGITIDVTKLNVFQISFQYLGAGAIDYSLEDPETGRFFCFHKIKYANANIVPSLTNPTLPLRIFTDNGGTTSDVVLKSGSMAGFVEGKNVELGFTNAFGADQAAITTEEPILSIRCNTTFQSTTNKVRMKVKLFTVASEGNGNNVVHYFVRQNATTLTGASFTDLDANTSVAQTDTSASVVSGGDLVTDFVLQRDFSDKFFIDTIKLFLNPGDTLTISAFSASSVGASASITWEELF